MTSDPSIGPLLLAIDTAGSACSVAVGRGTEVLATERQVMRHGHAEALLPMINRVMTASGMPRSALDGVAVAVGPGGFTGIRVALGAAHGIALALNTRLIGVTSFRAVAVRLPATSQTVLIALDSRREEFYVQLFDGSTAAPFAEPVAILPNTLAEFVEGLHGDGPLLVAGDIAEIAGAALGNRFDAEIVAGSAPDAQGVLAAALQQIERDPDDNPVRALYLRPPDVTLPTGRGSVAAQR